MGQPNPEIGLLVIGHGTRKREGVEQLLALADQMRWELPSACIEPCFLELAEPTIEEGVENLAKRGCKQVLSIPILLFAAGHAKTDIPQAVSSALHRRRMIDLGSTPPLSCHPSVLALSKKRFDEALRKAPSVDIPHHSIGLAMVGRGASDRLAVKEMLRLTHLRRSSESLTWGKTGFMAIARPNLRELLLGVQRSACACVVVQPHLLFAGTLLDEICETVEEFQGRDPERRWITAEPLGCDRELASIFVGFARQKLASPSDWVV